MRSAYTVLGVPGDASPQEIETAFRKAEALFPRQRLAEEEGAPARLAELRAAHQVLKDPESRAAHDRKLLQQVRPAVRPRTVVEVVEEPSATRKVMSIGLVVVAIVFAAGFYVTHRNTETRRQMAAQELAAQKAAVEEARLKREEDERAAAHSARLAAQAEANERRLVQESRITVVRAQSDQRMQDAAAAQANRMAMAEQQRREANRLSDDRRAAMEARQRTERDKQKIRETCYQLYRRPDC